MMLKKPALLTITMFFLFDASCLAAPRSANTISMGSILRPRAAGENLTEYELVDASGNSIRVNPEVGGTVVSYKVGGREFMHPRGIPLCFPFGGSIPGGIVKIDEVRYNLCELLDGKPYADIRRKKSGEPVGINHGFVRYDRCIVEETGARNGHPFIRLSWSTDKYPDIWPVFGHQHLQMTYSFSDEGELVIECTQSNTGSGEAPSVLWIHPWFLLGDRRDEWEAQVPGEREWVTREDGTFSGLTRPVDGTPFDYRIGRRLKPGADIVLTGAVPDEGGWVKSCLRGPDGTTIEIRHNAVNTVFFVDKKIDEDRNKTSCVEAATAPPEAIRLAVEGHIPKDRVFLNAGGSRTTRMIISVRRSPAGRITSGPDSRSIQGSI